MLWQTVSEDVIRESIMRARVEFEKSQKRTIEIRKELYDGMLQKQVELRIRQMFSVRDEADELVRLSSRTMNVAKYVVNAIATLYNAGVSRRWMLDEPVRDEETKRRTIYDDETSDVYASILDKCDANQILRTVQRMTVLCHDCILRYSYTARGHVLFPMTRDMCDVIQDKDDPRIVVGVIWFTSRTQTPAFQGNTALDMAWHYMDATMHKVFDKGGKLAYSEPNKYAPLNAQVNSYDGTGMFAPFIDFHDEPRWTTFWRENLDEVLIEATIEACVWLSYLNGQLKYSTFKQAWKAASLQGSGTGVTQQARQMEGGFTRVANVGAGGTMGLLDYTVVLAQVIDVLREKLRLLGTCMDMGDNAFQISASPESGVAIRLRADNLDERQSTEAAQYTRKERTLARTIQYASGLAPSGAGFEGYPEEDRIPPAANSAKLRVDFADVTKKGMDAEQREYWRWKLEAGLATVAQFLMAENPDLDEEEAQQLADDIQSETTKRSAARTDASVYGTGASFIPRPEPAVTEDEDSPTDEEATP
jgi:hypothetical protein